MDFRFQARGHAAVLSTHATTLEVTKEKALTERGDCVVAVGSSAGLKDLPPAMKKALANKGVKARLTLEIGNKQFAVEGQGDPGLTFSHPTDLVIRKSGFVSDRTLMVHADRAAADIPRPFVRLLQDPAQKVSVQLTIEP